MGAQGSVTLDFGPWPGDPDAFVLVTGQAGILSGSKVEAWISLETSTPEHTVDEHRVENLKITAGTIVAGTGFTVYGEAQNPVGKGAAGNQVYGRWTVNWVWN